MLVADKIREEAAMADDVRVAISADQEVIRLWPDGPPSVIAGLGPETMFSPPEGLAAGTTMLRNVSEPTLTVFRPNAAKANGVGVIVCPGGGWRILAWDHEGIDMARWLASRGYTAFLLKYRLMGTPADPAAFAKAMAAIDATVAQPMSGAKAPRSITEIVNDAAFHQARGVALADGRRAVELIAARAAEWGVQPNRIGMIGFSAGAFLTADVAMAPGAARLAFAAPIYGGETGGRPVPADAPSLFTCIAQDDRILFKVVEGLYADWSNADRPAELHIFARGGHGFGMIRQGLPVDRWSDLLADWLADQGFA
jgi:dienelactone hydrolase